MIKLKSNVIPQFLFLLILYHSSKKENYSKRFKNGIENIEEDEDEEMKAGDSIVFNMQEFDNSFIP